MIPVFSANNEFYLRRYNHLWMRKWYSKNCKVLNGGLWRHGAASIVRITIGLNRNVRTSIFRISNRLRLNFVATTISSCTVCVKSYVLYQVWSNSTLTFSSPLWFLPISASTVFHWSRIESEIRSSGFPTALWNRDF